ncbi:MAG TPA: acyloxyacyl hydrolase, partial [Firmicutes bacterium]|nr:acyloxyacyl hydrolase [Bacillota bacterium]
MVWLIRHLIFLAPAMILLAGVPMTALASADSVTVTVGHGQGKLPPPQNNYDFIHMGVIFSHEANGWIEEQTGWDPPGEWSFDVMPYLGIINEPDTNVEVSVGVGLRIGVPLGSKWTPYVYGGGGPIFVTQDIRGQSTDLNFGSYAGFGLSHHLNQHNSIGVIYAIRHFSNASVRDPNNGVDINAWAVTYT